ncbi:hypothetical protein [Methylocapsa acidiphila]|uniref:hypothetical protein n=1 Tax=Methylocapsa acidiphila TaxID=133552 RepID=UPI0003F821BC|nr:hypothetical protein [Methylocapsa acidiphila]
MSAFGTFGSFVKKTLEGVAEILSAPFVGDQQSAAAPAVAPSSPSCPPSLPTSPPTAVRGESAALVADCALETIAKGRTLSDAPYGPDYPASAATRRYRALKAEGLTPKQAREFSHSAKKFAQYKSLSTTRSNGSALTNWGRLEAFDQGVEAYVRRRKQTGALKQDLKIIEAEIERARELLIQKFIDGEDALTNDHVLLIEKVSAAIAVTGSGSRPGVAI